MAIIVGLESCMGHNENAIGEEGNVKPPQNFLFHRKKQEPCLWLLLSLKSSVLCSYTVIYEGSYFQETFIQIMFVNCRSHFI